MFISVQGPTPVTVLVWAEADRKEAALNTEMASIRKIRAATAGP